MNYELMSQWLVMQVLINKTGYLIKMDSKGQNLIQKVIWKSLTDCCLIEDFYLVEEYSDWVLQSCPADDGFRGRQEQDITMKIVLNQHNAVRRNAKVSFNLRRK